MIPEWGFWFQTLDSCLNRLLLNSSSTIRLLLGYRSLERIPHPFSDSLKMILRPSNVCSWWLNVWNLINIFMRRFPEEKTLKLSVKRRVIKARNLWFTTFRIIILRLPGHPDSGRIILNPRTLRSHSFILWILNCAVFEIIYLITKWSVIQFCFG